MNLCKQTHTFNPAVNLNRKENTYFRSSHNSDFAAVLWHPSVDTWTRISSGFEHQTASTPTSVANLLLRLKGIMYVYVLFKEGYEPSYQTRIKTVRKNTRWIPSFVSCVLGDPCTALILPYIRKNEFMTKYHRVFCGKASFVP